MNMNPIYVVMAVKTGLIIFLVIMAILIAAIVALYILGKKAQKKQAEQQAFMEANKQTVSMLIIDKKRMKIKESGLPQAVIDQTPKLMRNTKLPIVKVKVGPQIMNLISDEKIFDAIPLKKEVKATVSGIWQGVMSLKGVRNLPLFIFFTLGIWISYFLHYYLTFFCFEATEHLGLACALVTFVVGSIAVIVPTPNGAGPWHFAVKTMLILYGVMDEYALYFVLIVHTVQTMLVVVLGIYAWAALSFTKRNNLKITTS